MDFTTASGAERSCSKRAQQEAVGQANQRPTIQAAVILPRIDCQQTSQNVASVSGMGPCISFTLSFVNVCHGCGEVQPFFGTLTVDEL